MDHLRNLPPVDGDKPVMVAGDPERKSMQSVDKVGAIKYTPNHIVTYRKLAEELKVKPMEAFKK